jgi:hypothetical protein
MNEVKTISELIAVLERTLRAHGDLPVEFGDPTHRQFACVLFDHSKVPPHPTRVVMQAIDLPEVPA